MSHQIGDNVTIDGSFNFEDFVMDGPSSPPSFMQVFYSPPRRSNKFLKNRHPSLLQHFISSQSPSKDQAKSGQGEILLDVFFERFHGRTYYMLDKSTIRERLRHNDLPGFFSCAIFALAIRDTPLLGRWKSDNQQSYNLALRARAEIEVDDTSIDAIQALLLLVLAFSAEGDNESAYMLLARAIGAVLFRGLHREDKGNSSLTDGDRESRRRTFWTCYLLDRFFSCDSSRIPLINDEAIILRFPDLPAKSQDTNRELGLLPVELRRFVCQETSEASESRVALLIKITRILGLTTKYLASGGLDGDTEYPWSPQSKLSDIQQYLNKWISSAGKEFTTVESLIGRPDSMPLLMSKLIYHVIYCSIYRPFLPIELTELTNPGLYQPWRTKATFLCFSHANAITEIVEIANTNRSIHWPAFVSYCLCTAATVHMHGSYYYKDTKGVSEQFKVYEKSPELLSREMTQLESLTKVWHNVRQQIDTLRALKNAHHSLFHEICKMPMRYRPSFFLGDFFDRYSYLGGEDSWKLNFDALNQP
ncbi:hypothetical protein BU24DRAFT_477753 [Aaosphaeria arxii CBS 175.79]|uniref:Xylanolytic transcriptional activator regulatory domain-containing protein n=1 Tax=Aaosphaeria arxii CBS 175.79 TaxID=1450172 RepID=A0A6A5XV53_9PLEO|nr:uncharacterized protein BU24DRAFT_477753 [Aaosphaeria arxii CBS 175.79]KAF2016813.1 hypothetical protein BU24DRAFT_477753 [Aaosphaeria arxii CBS 175.79]